MNRKGALEIVEGVIEYATDRDMLQEDVEEAEEALAYLMSLPRWLPIETAPKMGDEILICDHENQVVAFWDVHPDRSIYETDTDEMAQEKYTWVMANNRSFYEVIFEPTHWQPLPPPPGEDTRPQNPSSWWNLESSMQTGSQPPQPQEGEDLIQLSPENLEHVKTIVKTHNPRMWTGPDGEPLKKKKDSPQPCPECGGTGREYDENEVSILGADMGPCKACSGIGEV